MIINSVEIFISHLHQVFHPVDFVLQLFDKEILVSAFVFGQQGSHLVKITLPPQADGDELAEPALEVVAVEVLLHKLNLVKELVSEVLTILLLVTVHEERY